MEFGLERPQCDHQILSSPYERNSPEVRQWWYKLLDLIEADAAIPPDKRFEVLSEIFPNKLLNRILSILSFVPNCDRLPEIQVEECSEYGRKVQDDSAPEASLPEKNRVEIGPNNPYTKFFKRRLDRAAIWHTLPPLSLEEMNLCQKAEAITETIATGFVEWMKNISDEDSPTTLTVPLVTKMFEIGFNTHAAKSLQVRMKEMASVPDGVAILKSVPHMAKRSQLHRQLQRDLRASKQTKKVFAFGTKLERKNRVYPPKEMEILKWLVCTRVPQELKSMAAVWQGITHLRSTRAFCEYLLDHPEITPPEYLVEMKMMDRTILKKSIYKASLIQEESIKIPELETNENEKEHDEYIG